MKKTDQIPVVLLPLYALSAAILVWGLVRLSAQVVFNDSAWQALDAGGASWEHHFAEAIHQIPFLLPSFIVVSNGTGMSWYGASWRSNENADIELAKMKAGSTLPDDGVRRICGAGLRLECGHNGISHAEARR